jgi:hypothetical protein
VARTRSAIGKEERALPAQLLPERRALELPPDLSSHLAGVRAHERRAEEIRDEARRAEAAEQEASEQQQQQLAQPEGAERGGADENQPARSDRAQRSLPAPLEGGYLALSEALGGGDGQLCRLCECHICFRQFAQDRIETHIRVCERQQKGRPRKAFNAAKQRLEGLDQVDETLLSPRPNPP